MVVHGDEKNVDLKNEDDTGEILSLNHIGTGAAASAQSYNVLIGPQVFA